jgi:rhodanese-related sulfurtransferase
VSFIRDNWWLFVIAIVSGIGIVWPTIAKMMSGIPQIGVTEAVTLINRRDPLVLDVRSQAEFNNGHIGGARLIPVGELKSRLADLEKFKDKPVLVHCATGNRSQGAAKMLKDAGFKEVFNLQGGLGAWQQAGMPVEK